MNEIIAKYVLKYMLLSLAIAGECDPACMPDPELAVRGFFMSENHSGLIPPDQHRFLQL